MKPRMQSLTPPYRCALGLVQPQVTDLDAIKRQGWQNEQILVVKATDDRLDFMERELVQRLGSRLYGNRIKSGSKQGGGT